MGVDCGMVVRGIVVCSFRLRRMVGREWWVVVVVFLWGERSSGV